MIAPMIVLLSATAAAAMPAPHRIAVEHRGAHYDIGYRPAATMTTRTVGMAAGSKPSGERCRWTTTVRVERSIRRAGDTGSAIATMLPAARTLGGQTPGDCRQVRARVTRASAAQVAKIETHLIETAQADRAAALAAIDAAFSLAQR